MRRSLAVLALFCAVAVASAAPAADEAVDATDMTAALSAPEPAAQAMDFVEETDAWGRRRRRRRRFGDSRRRFSDARRRFSDARRRRTFYDRRRRFGDSRRRRTFYDRRRRFSDNRRRRTFYDRRRRRTFYARRRRTFYDRRRRRTTYYRRRRTFYARRRRCGRGQYRYTGGNGSCPGCQANKYQTSNSHNSGSCITQPTCPAGQKMSADSKTARRTCGSCPTNKYKTGNNRGTSCTTQPTCPAGQKMSGDTKAARRTCGSCPNGQFKTVNNRDTSCNAWNVCATSHPTEWQTKAPSKTWDRLCDTHSICTPVQFISKQATPTSDRECLGRGHCANGSLIAAFQANQVNHCGACNAGYYLSNKACLPYGGNCANGSLSAQALRTKHNHCGSCDAGFVLTTANTCKNGGCQTASGFKGHGAKYSGAGKNFCNQCRCHAGTEVCTKRSCNIHSSAKVCATTTCVYGVRFAGTDAVVSEDKAAQISGANWAALPHEMSTLVQHNSADANGAKFSCGHVQHTSECKCYCSSVGSRHIWMRAKRHADSVSAGHTSAGCKCQANWAFDGSIYNGCQSPKSTPAGLLDTNTNHGDKHAAWCKIVAGSCGDGIANAVTAGADWDTCEAHANLDLQIPSRL